MPPPLNPQEADRRRAVVVECRRQGKPIAEAARILGLKPNTLKEWILGQGGVETIVAAAPLVAIGYKVLDKYASRISRGGKLPKIRGRAHWIVFDTQAEYDETFGVAFKSPRQAEAYLNGLQNLRAA